LHDFLLTSNKWVIGAAFGDGTLEKLWGGGSTKKKLCKEELREKKSRTTSSPEKLFLS